jgi:hypothetical protein
MRHNEQSLACGAREDFIAGPRAHSAVADAHEVNCGLMAENRCDNMFVWVMIGQESRLSHCVFALVLAALSRSLWTTGLSMALAFSRHCFQTLSCLRR